MAKKIEVSPENRILAVAKDSGIVAIAVDSSFITQVKYCFENRQIEITMKGGKSYVYDGCSRERFRQLVLADSIGKEYNTSIKGELECLNGA